MPGLNLNYLLQHLNQQPHLSSSLMLPGLGTTSLVLLLSQRGIHYHNRLHSFQGQQLAEGERLVIVIGTCVSQNQEEYQCLFKVLPEREVKQLSIYHYSHISGCYSPSHFLPLEIAGRKYEGLAEENMFLKTLDREDMTMKHLEIPQCSP